MSRTEYRLSSQSDQATKAGTAFAELVATVEELRNPGGCPWDAEQTHLSLRPNLLEETYEALEAIDSGRRPPQNRGTANAGRILGIVGTVLIGIALVFLVLVLVGAFASNL